MPADTKLVAMLRHPFSRMQSAVLYFGIHKRLGPKLNISTDDLQSILKAYLSNQILLQKDRTKY